MNDNIEKNLNLENLESSELEQVSGGMPMDDPLFLRRLFANALANENKKSAKSIYNLLKRCSSPAELECLRNMYKNVFKEDI